MILKNKKHSVFNIGILFLFGLFCGCNNNEKSSSNQNSEGVVVSDSNQSSREDLSFEDEDIAELNENENEMNQEDESKFDTFFDDLLDVDDKEEENLPLKEDENNKTNTEINQESNKNETLSSDNLVSSTDQVLMDDDTGDVAHSVNVSEVTQNSEPNKNLLEVPVVSNDNKKVNFTFYPRVAFVKDKLTPTNELDSKTVSSADESTSKKMWEAVKYHVENRKKSKPFSKTIFVSMLSAPKEDSEFDHSDSKNLILDSIEMKKNNESIVNNGKMAIGSKVGLPLVIYERPEKKGLFKKNVSQNCSIKKGAYSYCIPDFTRRPKSCWSKDKKWRKLDIHLHPNLLDEVLKEQLDIDGEIKTYEEWVKYLRENMPEKKMGKIQKDEDRDNKKHQISMNLLQKLMNGSELHVQFTLKDPNNKGEEIFEGKSILNVELEQKESVEETDDNKINWNLILKAGPLEITSK